MYCPQAESTKNYSPSAIGSKDGFYGPQKILSYNTNYLYIADYGQNLILDEYKIVYFKPVSRIVKVNIQNMTIEDVMEINSATPFILAESLILPDSGDGREAYTGEGYSYMGAKYPVILEEE